MELTINNLSKEYGKKKAVRCFNATLTNGVYGLLAQMVQVKLSLHAYDVECSNQKLKGLLCSMAKHSRS